MIGAVGITEIISLVTGLIALAAAVMAWRTKKEVGEVHVTVNSQRDAMIKELDDLKDSQRDAMKVEIAQLRESMQISGMDVPRPPRDL